MVAHAPCISNSVYDGADGTVVSDHTEGVNSSRDAVLADATPPGKRSSARLQHKLKLDNAPGMSSSERPAARRKKPKMHLRSAGKTSNVGHRTGVDETADNRHLDDGGVARTDASMSRMDAGPSLTAKHCQENESPALVYQRKKGKRPLDTSSKELNDISPAAAPVPGTVGDGTSADDVDRSAHARVKDTIRIFNKFLLHFVQEEEKRCKKMEADERKSKASKSKAGTKDSKSKKGDSSEVDGKRPAKRPDLKAVTKMLETNSILYPSKRFGHIPGVDVGFQFFSRAEMVAVGFHSHWLNGIDYMGQSYCSGEYAKYTFPLAVSIVMSGQYEDDLDNCDDVLYTGQGGNNLLGNKRQVNNQVMQRGNLALKNSIDQSIPVRVVRGHKSASSYVGKVYTYDGLYKVVNYWAEQGVSGFTIYKFRLRRLEGQPTLTTNQVHYFRGKVPNSVLDIRGLVCEDISEGQEAVAIPATNLVDDPPMGPTGFTYYKSIHVSTTVQLPANASGCNCKRTCIDPRRCACAQLNGSDFPYVHRDGGRLIEAKAVVFECGPNCGCGPGCVNRTSQRGVKYRLEVFRTPKKGWAVRSWDFIPSGAPVCEYTGVLMRTDELNADADNNYIFDLDCLQTMKGLDGREKRLGDVHISEKSDGQKSESVPDFCIDAGSSGSIARFINHSCEPNLFVQCVLSSHHDIKLARVMLFAADNIPPMQELAYDYGYAVDSVVGADGKIKQLACYCGAADCRGRLF